MAEKKRVLLQSEDCFICGGDVELVTTIEQAANGWLALDGDPVECIQPECGARMYMAVDEESAYVAYDEEHAHNVECYKRWERQA